MDWRKNGDLKNQLTLSKDLVIFITHPSQIILQASLAVFRESSSPRIQFFIVFRKNVTLNAIKF